MIRGIGVSRGGEFGFSRSVSRRIQHNKVYGNIFNVILSGKCNRLERALILECIC